MPDRSEWVKARDKRQKEITAFTLENVPNLNKMPLNYQYRATKSMFVRSGLCYPMTNASAMVLELYYLAVLGTTLGYIKYSYEPRKERTGIDCTRPRITQSPFEPFYWRHDALDIWKQCLSTHLQPFFAELRADIEYQKKAKHAEEKREKEEADKSISNTRKILSYLRGILQCRG